AEARPIKATRMDADFSPVKRVNFHAESLAPPSASPERLILEVWTSGGVTPETAVADASRILAGQFALLIDVAGRPRAESGEVAEPPGGSAVIEIGRGSGRERGGGWGGGGGGRERKQRGVGGHRRE